MTREPERPRLSPRQIHDEVDEELRFHLEMRAGELESAGMDAAAARDAARRRFEDLAETRRRCADSDWRRERTMRRRAYLADVAQDLAHGFRQLRIRPRFTVPAVVTLAIGIGAATAIFGAADHVLFRPLPYPEPERVVTLWELDRSALDSRRQVSPGNLIDWKRRTTSFQAMGVAEPSGVDLTDTRPPTPVRAWSVSEGFLEALQVTPAFGRTFRADEYVAGSHAILISHDLWRSRFASDRNVVGRILQIDNQPHTVVGVLPHEMEYPERKDVWLPKVFREQESLDRRSSYLDAVARLKPGVTVAAATADLDRVSRQLAVEQPRTNASLGVTAIPIADHLLRRVRAALYVLLGAVTLMLLIACANIAGLLLARGAEREREFSIRSALGADRSRLARQLLTEALLLAFVGGAFGTAIAWGATRVLAAHGPEWLPRASSLGIDLRVLGVAIAITLGAAVLFGLFPALRFSGAGGDVLVTGARSTSGRRGARLRRGLVIAEIAFALVLMTGAGLLIRSFVRVLSNEVGFATADRVSLQMFLWDRNPTPAARVARTNEIMDALLRVPGVKEVGAVTALPFHPSQIDAQDEMSIEGRPVLGADPQIYTTIATPGYFQAVRIPLVAGRMFDRRDRGDAPRVAVINQTLARRWFPNEDPVGRFVRFGAMSAPERREIIGVVGDVRPTAFDSEPRPESYVPFEQTASGSLTFVIETSGDADRVMPALRSRIAAIDPLQTIYHASTLDDLIDRTLVERRFYLAIMSAFSLVALVLAGTGVYGLISMTTSQRLREIGVRLAVGAQPSDIVRMILGEGVVLIGIGLLLGLWGSFVFARALRTMLYPVGVEDPMTIVQVGAVLFGVSVVAALIPALRSGRVDPMTVLRHE